MCVSGAALVATGGAAWAQTITIEFGPIEIVRDGGTMTVEFGPGEIIEEGRRMTYMEGGEMVFELPPMEVLEGEMFFELPPMPVLEGEELIFYLPRQSITFDGGTDGGPDGGEGGGPEVPPCPPDTGCGG